MAAIAKAFGVVVAIIVDYAMKSDIAVGVLLQIINLSREFVL